MRVKKPENDVFLHIKANGRVLRKIKKKFVLPSEMIEIKSKSLDIETDINEIIFEVFPGGED